MKKWFAIGLTILAGFALTGCTASQSSSSTSSVFASGIKTIAVDKVTTPDKANKYYKDRLDSTKRFKKVTVTKGIMTIELKNYGFDGNFMNGGTAYNIAEYIGAASKMPLAKNGVAVIQNDTYMTKKGKQSKMLSYAAYYSRANLDKRTFKTYFKTVTKEPKKLFTNADGYYLNSALAKADGSKITALAGKKSGTDKEPMKTFFSEFNIH